MATDGGGLAISALHLPSSNVPAHKIKTSIKTNQSTRSHIPNESVMLDRKITWVVTISSYSKARAFRKQTC
jgi:hypothetical protein